MRILNLYAGIGGNRHLWSDCSVTSVESNPLVAELYHQRYPDDEIVICDAHDYLEANYSDFDFIWSSPPCQTHSRMNKGAISTRHGLVRYADLTLYEEIIFLEHFSKCPWVVENVRPYYIPLIEPTVIRHRHNFWYDGIQNLKFYDLPPLPGNFIQTQSISDMCAWYGIQPLGKKVLLGNSCHMQVYRNCTHPLIGLSFLDSLRGSRTPNQSFQDQLNLELIR
jgi:DNA (cytosine-5)-methyltransferase 1